MMKSHSRFAALILPLLIVSLVATGQAQDEEFLPTPYSAEQIRDAWTLGTQAITKVETPDRSTESRSWVSEWSQEGGTFCDVLIIEVGDPTPEESCAPFTWVELRNHARFPAATTTRERTQRFTSFGELEGWLYVIEHEDGARSEFFFADDHPGPPLIYGKISGETSLSHSEIRWIGRPAE